MIHPATRLQWMNDAVGYGVIATEDIPKGTILWTLDPLDRVFTPAEVARYTEAGLGPILERYAYVNGRGKRVLCWDNGRFMNHSCAPVSLSPGTEFEVATRDVRAGEEITCDYTSLNLEEDLSCLCGQPGCRGSVSASDFDELAPRWDAILRDSMRFVTRVPQPLLPWVAEADELAGWAADPTTLPSSIRHRYPVRELTRAVGR